ncbi:MAG: thioredoxin domain-containing protein [Pyrinomonadaceae bacterium]
MSKEVKVLGVIAVIIVIAAIVGANYYRSSVQNTRIVPVTNAGSSQNPSTTVASAEQLIRPDSATLGPANAQITLVEFYDPECESCAAFAPVVKQILKDYQGKIRLVTRYMPLHPNSVSAAAFTEAAGEQGKYWEAQALLFEKQPEWGTKHGAPSGTASPTFNELFDKYATELGLDRAKASSSVQAGKFNAKIEQDKNDGQSLGVRQTPTFFVNGRKLASFGEQHLRSLIDEELKK